MNCEHFEKYVGEQVLPNLPSGSVLVLDNAKYHCRKLERPITSSSRKAEMIAWLEKNDVEFDPQSTNKILYNKIKPYQDQSAKTVLEDMAEKFGCEIIRLPPYHCQLNPIESIWGILKNRIAKRNITYKMNDVERISREEIESITSSEWKNTVEHVIKIEDEYRKRMPKELDVPNLIIDLNSSESESEDDASSTCSSQL